MIKFISICGVCEKEYKEKSVVPRVGSDGTKYLGETIPNICDKCFKKKIKLLYILQQGILSGKINFEELKAYKNKTVSRETLDKWLRERKDGFYDNKQDIEKIKGVLVNE